MNREPEFRKRGNFKIVGIERYTGNGIPDIREAWQEFGNRSKEIKNAVHPGAYGVEDFSRNFDINNSGFPKYYYIAGLEVDSLSNIPQGMTGKEILGADYAVFTYNGSLDGLHDFFTYIYTDWMPHSGYIMDTALQLDFEFYPEQVMDMHAAKVEIWVPVIKG